jgi:hypothetical protein
VIIGDVSDSSPLITFGLAELHLTRQGEVRSTRRNLGAAPDPPSCSAVQSSSAKLQLTYRAANATNGDRVLAAPLYGVIGEAKAD